MIRFIGRMATVFLVASHLADVGLAERGMSAGDASTADVGADADLRSSPGLVGSRFEQLLQTRRVVCLEALTQYVSWPAHAWRDAELVFVIGVMDDDALARMLSQRVSGKLVQGRHIVVKDFKTLADYKPCHMLFLTESTPHEVGKAVIRQTRNQPVLLVGERRSYCQLGSTVNFVPMSDGTIKIEMNIDSMNRRELRASAMLLKLATVVRDGEAE